MNNLVCGQHVRTSSWQLVDSFLTAFGQLFDSFLDSFRTAFWQLLTAFGQLLTAFDSFRTAFDSFLDSFLDSLRFETIIISVFQSLRLHCFIKFVYSWGSCTNVSFWFYMFQDVRSLLSSFSFSCGFISAAVASTLAGAQVADAAAVTSDTE